MKRCRDAEIADDAPKMASTGDENIERKENDHECQGDGHQHAGGEENYRDDDNKDELEALNGEQVVEEMSKLCEGLQMFMSVACPSVTMDVDSTTKACLRYFEEEKSKFKQVLNNMDRSIAISIDVLTGCKPCGSYADFMCMQAHFIDDDWKLTKRVLCFHEYLINMDYDLIGVSILKPLKDWNIEDKVSNITWRQLNEFDKDVDTVKARVMKKRRLPLGASFFSVRCAAEMFSSMAEDAFCEIRRSNFVDKKKIETLSWSNSERMWHLTISKLKNDLDLHLMGEFNTEPVPSDDEWEKLKVVHRLLECAYNVAKLLFETKYPSPANKFLYDLQGLRTILVKECTSSDTFTRGVAEVMLQGLDEYLKDMFLLLAVVSVLDPRCKMHYIEYMSSKFDDVQSGPVLEAFHSLGAYYANLDTQKSNSKPDKEKVEIETETWLREYSRFVQTNNPPKKSDLDSYLDDPVLPWTDEFNTLEWWRSEASKYPVVAKMARDILAIPLSVATSYDAYYHERCTNKHVIASGPELMNALMCCRSWSLKKMA